MGTSAGPKNFRLAMLVLALGTFIVFGRVLTCGFVFDDGPYVLQNEHVNSGVAVSSIVWSLTGVHGANWHPLTWMSHMVDFSIYHPHPAGHHATNLIFHIANVLLLFLVLNRMTRSLWKSAFVAALFAIHPLHIESVAWVTERKDVLSTFFFLLTILAYVHYVDKPGLGRYILIVAAFALGLMSKPMLVTLPFVLLLLDYWPLSRMKSGGLRWGLVWEKAPLFALSAASCVITYFAQREQGAVMATTVFPFGLRVENALVSYAAYMWKMVWPARLAVFYPHPFRYPAWEIIVAVLVLAGISALVIKGAKKHPFLAVGWLWYTGILIPVIGLVQVGGQAMADRYTYLPLIGLFIMIAWGVPEIVSRLGKKRSLRNAYPSLAAVVLLPMMISTMCQLGYWKNDITLFSHALAVTTDNAKAEYNLASGYLAAGKLDAAMDHFRQALRLNPNNAEAHCNLGTALYRQGRISAAIDEYQLAARDDPQYATAHYNLAVALQKLGRHTEAEREYSQAISSQHGREEIPRLAPAKKACPTRPAISGGSSQEHCAKGLAYARAGEIQRAEAEFQEAVRLDGTNAEAHCNLGCAFNAQERWDEGIGELKIALSLKPSLAPAHCNMAVALFATGDCAGSWEHVREAEQAGAQLQPQFIEALTATMPRPR